MILFIPLSAILKKLLELSPKTEVYGFLMGEENPDKIKTKKPKPFFSALQNISRKIKNKFR